MVRSASPRQQANPRRGDGVTFVSIRKADIKAFRKLDGDGVSFVSIRIVSGIAELGSTRRTAAQTKSDKRDTVPFEIALASVACAIAPVLETRQKRHRPRQQSSPNISLKTVSKPAPIAKYQTGREPLER